MIFQTPHVISGLLMDGTQVSYFLRCSNQDITFYCYRVMLFYYRVQKFVTSVASVSVRKLLLFLHYIGMHCSNIN